MSIRLFVSLSLALLTTLLVAGSVLAAPPPPYDVYGTVTVNGANVADGTPISVQCDGVTYASTTTTTIDGQSWYLGPTGSGPLSVPGNDSDTPEKDGCNEGETVTFLINGVQTDQTGTWGSGNSTQIDLVLTTTTAPFHVYGTVLFGGAPAGAGSYIHIYCSGWHIASAEPAIEEGQAVYAYDIPADDPVTGWREGCNEGEGVQFVVNGHWAVQSTTWSAGGSAAVNLTVTFQPSVYVPYKTQVHLGESVAIPVSLSTGGHSVASAAFSIDFDQTCLAFDPTDSDENGIPDAVTILTPGAFTAHVTTNLADEDSEIDFFIGDELGPLAALNNGVLAEITLTVSNNSACLTPATSYMAAVGFSGDPYASFGGTNGLAIDGYQSDGYIEITWVQGDGNGDNTVDAGDIAACILEIFDGDGHWWLNAAYGTYAGTPGCDANRDDYINAGDISCTVLIIFEGSGSCGVGPASRTAQAAAVLAIAGDQVTVDGTRVTIPIRLQSNGAQISTAAFALRFDPVRFHLAANDAVTAAATTATVMTQAQGEDTLQVFVGNLNGVRQSFADGVLTTVTLEAQTATDVAAVIKGVTFAETTPASLGTTDGAAVSVTTQDGNGQTVQPVMRLYMPLIVGR